MTSNENPIIGNIKNTVDSKREGVLTTFSTIEADGVNKPLLTQQAATTMDDSSDKMRKSIRSWAGWLVMWVVISAISSNVEWAIVLAAVSVMSFYFYDFSGMFIVYGGLMAWAAIWNILIGGEASWMVMGVVQLVFAVSSCLEYRKYRHINHRKLIDTLSMEPTPSLSSNRESHAAWLSLFFGLFSLIGFCSLIPMSIALLNQSIEPWIDWVFNLIFDLGFLGVPLGIAALLTGQRRKGASIGGIVLGSLSPLVLIISLILPSGG